MLMIVDVKMPKGSYSCDKCPSVFTQHAALVRHQGNHALSESIPAQESGTEQSFKLSSHRNGAIMRCTTCDLAFTTVGKYQSHMGKYHGKALECEDCDKRFTLPNALKRHRLTQHTQFPRRCDECGHFCKTKEEFIDHLKDAHDMDDGLSSEIVPCEVCGALIKGKGSLLTHMKNMHEVAKETFSCDVCGKVLKNKYSLEYHKRSHTGEYPFRCDECGRGFMTRKKMNQCKNNHAGIFRLRCTLCDFRTNDDASFKRHRQTHSTEKPFICPVCAHTSAHVGALGSHIRKCHKLTVLQAEITSRRTRFGVPMTDEEIAEHKKKAEHAEKVQETCRLRENEPGYIHPNHSSAIKINKKKPAADDESHEGPPTLYPPPSRILYPYF